jgi:hypothetical protein
MIIAIIIANVIVIFSEEYSNKHSISLWTLNITAATASILCIIVICKYGIHGLNGKSYLFLALGIISWFSTDFTLLYNYYAFGIEEQRLVTYRCFMVCGIWISCFTSIYSNTFFTP